MHGFDTAPSSGLPIFKGCHNMTVVTSRLGDTFVIQIAYCMQNAQYSHVVAGCVTLPYNYTTDRKA